MFFFLYEYQVYVLGIGNKDVWGIFDRLFECFLLGVVGGDR